MQGIVFAEANESGLVVKASIRCTGIERVLLLDELRKALNYGKDEFVRDALTIAAVDFDRYTKREEYDSKEDGNENAES